MAIPTINGCDLADRKHRAQTAGAPKPSQMGGWAGCLGQLLWCSHTSDRAWRVLVEALVGAVIVEVADILVEDERRVLLVVD